MSEKLEIIITASDQASAVFHKVGGALGTVFKVGAAGAAVGLGLFTTGLGIAVNEAMDAEVNIAKLNAVIKSTGGVAGITSDEAQKMAEALSKVTRFSDDAILQGETMLLTFTNIGEDVFPRATESMLNMAEMFGGDATQAALQLGKALNDPIEGVGALRRVGVQLTAQQEEQIKAMVEAGNVAGAQNVILKELEKEFGGVAKAAGETAAGKLTIFKNMLLNIAENVGMKVLPIVTALIDQMIMGLEPAVAAVSAALFNLLDATEPVREALSLLFDIFTEFGVSGVFTLQFWMALNNLFGSEWGNRIREIAVSFGELYLQVRDLVERVIVPFINQHAGIFINAFERLGALLAGGIGVAVVTGLLTTLAGVIGALFSPIVLIIGAVTALSVAYDTNFMGMKDAVDAFASWFTGEAMPAIRDFIVEDAIPALQWLATELGNLWDLAKPKLQELALWFLDSALPAIGDFIINDAIPALQWLWGELVNLWDKAEPKLSALFNWLAVEALPTARDFLVNDVIPAIGDVTGALMDIWDKAQPKLESFYNFVTDQIGGLKVNVFDPLAEIIDTIIGAIQTLVDWIGRIDFPEPPGWLQDAGGFLGGIGGFQGGGSFRGFGMTGEGGGRELVYAPGGAVVFPNDMTERLLAARGGTTNNFNLNLHSNAGTERVRDDFQIMQTLA